MPALALTDLANAFGLIKFYKAARARGVKPIAGCDVWITHESERDAPFRAILLVASRAGYLRLCEWLTRAYRTNQHRGRAELRREWFADGTDGLLALSGGRGGDVGAALAQGNAAAAIKAAREWASWFPQRYYLEVQRAGHHDDDALVTATVALAAERPARGRDASGPVSGARRFPAARSACALRRVMCSRTRAVRDASRRSSTSRPRPRWRRASPIFRRRSPIAWRSRSAAI
jgi:DNA polymerase III alpha subunit